MTKGIIFLLFIYSAALGQQHFLPVQATGKPYQLIISEIRGFPIVAGISEIAIFDSNLCCGANVIDSVTNLNIVVWEEDLAYNLLGFKPGNEISIRIWTNLEGEWREEEADFDLQHGNGLFGNDLYTQLILKIPEASMPIESSGIPDKPVLGLYPNPVNSALWISYTLCQKENVSLYLYDLKGRLIKTLLNNNRQEPGYHEIRMGDYFDHYQNLSSGLYFISFKAENYILNKKFIIQK